MKFVFFLSSVKLKKKSRLSVKVKDTLRKHTYMGATGRKKLFFITSRAIFSHSWHSRYFFAGFLSQAKRKLFICYMW